MKGALKETMEKGPKAGYNSHKNPEHTQYWPSDRHAPTPECGVLAEIPPQLLYAHKSHGSIPEVFTESLIHESKGTINNATTNKSVPHTELKGKGKGK